MKINYLNWDSSFFKKKIGVIHDHNLCEEHVDLLQAKMREEKYDLLYVFCERNEKAIQDHLVRQGAILYDQKLTFIKNIDPNPKNIYQIEEYDGKLTEELMELTLLSGHKSRFKKDEKLNDHFELLYQKWIERSLKKEIADATFVYDKNNIGGFVTLKKNKNIGQIGLIAVGSKFQGNGIGKLLLSKAEEWYAHNEIQTAKVITQRENEGACSLYRKFGYQLHKTRFVYHLWSDK